MEDMELPDGHAGIVAVYPPGTKVQHRFGGEAHVTYTSYVQALPQPDGVLRHVLVREDFQRYDAVLVFDAEGTLVGVKDVMLEVGTDAFCDFRLGVDSLSFPAGMVRVVYLPTPVAYRVHGFFEEYLERHGMPPVNGGLIAGAILFEENQSRPGGKPLVVPPPFQPEGRQLPPRYATGNPRRDRQVVCVAEFAYGVRDGDGRLRVSARGGFGLRGPVVVDLYNQLTAQQADEPFDIGTPLGWARRVMSVRLD